MKKFDFIDKAFLIKEYIESGKSKSQLARELNCGYDTIKDRLIKYNIPTKALSEALRGRKIGLRGRRNIAIAKIGDKNANWKGGKYIDKDGYVIIRIYPNGKNHKGEIVDEHRFVMERYLGRKLKRNELVHHKNGIKDDNRLCNLQIVLNNAHRGKVRCPYCKKEFLIK